MTDFVDRAVEIAQSIINKYAVIKPCFNNYGIAYKCNYDNQTLDFDDEDSKETEKTLLEKLSAIQTTILLDLK